MRHLRTGTELREADIDDLTVPEIRLRIAMRVAYHKRNPESPLGKRELNTIHCYLTGEYHFPFKHLQTTDSPGIGTLRQAAMEEIGYKAYSFSSEEGHDRTAEDARWLRRKELKVLLVEIERRDDLRPVPEAPA